MTHSQWGVYCASRDREGKSRRGGRREEAVSRVHGFIHVHILYMYMYIHTCSCFALSQLIVHAHVRWETCQDFMYQVADALPPSPSPSLPPPTATGRLSAECLALCCALPSGGAAVLPWAAAGLLVPSRVAQADRLPLPPAQSHLRYCEGVGGRMGGRECVGVG